ncbi:protealysin inhibitor emfourin [Streptomyces sp. NPDC020917]|uniref:protealysin inhibitor emfourin n=1 Tax=Streptomyces sp. NPDC020917 TaxID=3365102 RepID=UPI0037A14472
MRIEVVRSGGLAGISRRAAIDTTGRPDAGHLHALAEAALAPGYPQAPVPDGYSYDITVDSRTVHCADPQLTQAQRELIEVLLDEGA